MEIELYFDGASRGNPGKGSYGVYIKMKDQQLFMNGYIEYIGLQMGMKGLEKYLQKQNIGQDTVDLKIFGDSLLVINQLNKKWKVKSTKLQQYYDNINQQFSKYKTVEMKHVKREFNKMADGLANDALDILDAFYE